MMSDEEEIQGIDFLDLVSDESEFVNFYPDGYKIGRTKYIFITGGVMSGVGKGVFAASLAHLLKIRGYSVTTVKMEGYLNIDSGTLNPYRHGEVFVLDDGTEVDLDLGSYERFLDLNLNRNNFITSGRIYSLLLSKERSGKYLGRDVLVIPHLTGEIKHLWRFKASEDDYDFLLIEIGGTVGDYENLYFIEAAREVRYEEGKENVLFCHVTPIVFSEHSNELKSKPTQHSVKSLNQLGIQPDVIICRCKNPLTNRIKEKVSLYCNVPMQNTIENPDTDSVYLLPSFLDKSEKVVEIITSNLNIRPIKRTKPLKYPLDEYATALKKAKNKKPVNIVIAGKYTQNKDAYISIASAIEHAGTSLGVYTKLIYLEVTEFDDKAVRTDSLRDAHGIIIPGGFGRRGVEGKIKLINFARENKYPFLGLCLGFQLSLVEIARNVATLKGANSTEFEPNTEYPIIDLLPDQKEIDKLGGTMRLGGHRVKILSGTKTFSLYQKEEVEERFRHRYEFNRDFENVMNDAGVVFSGMTPDMKILQVFELTNHPYFIATQYHPEFISRPLRPHPLFMGLISASLKKAQQ